MSNETGIKLASSMDASFKELISQGIMIHMEIVNEISESAGKEHAIEEMLNKMKSEWKEQKIEVSPYKNTGCH